jgi:hypothetical protein
MAFDKNNSIYAADLRRGHISRRRNPLIADLLRQLANRLLPYF